MRFKTVVVLAVLAAAAPVRSQDAAKPSIAGAWTLNRELSDQASGGREGRDGSERGRGRDGGSGGRRGGGGFGGGGFGGRGGGMGRGGGRGQQMDPEETARMRDAMQAITEASDHLVITQTESMIVITGKDGRTTRFSPDGKKIKDDNTKIERKTKWEGAKLVSEINGAGLGKITQTFNLDPESHQLRIVLQMEGGGRGNNQPRSITHVYDADQR